MQQPFSILKPYIFELFIEHEVLKNMDNINKLISDKDLEKNIKSAVEYFGIDFVINAIGLKKVINEVGLKKVINEVGLKKVIETIGEDKILDYFGKDKIRQYINT